MVPNFIRLARFAAFVLATSATVGAQTTWYVDAQAAPPGIGTPAEPFASIQYAISRPKTVAGDTVLVAPGTYDEAITINKAITVRSSHGPLQTTLLPGPVPIDDGVVLFGPVATTIVEGFTVAEGGGWSGIYLAGGTARGCIVRDCHGVTGIDCVDAIVESCTVVHNRHGLVGQPYGGAIVLRESIVWDNWQANVNPAGASFAASYSAGFGSSQNGNLPGDPGLWNLAENDFRLRPGSPCIDAGDPASPLDPDGSPSDMGVLVYDPTYAPGPTTYCTGKLNSQGCTPAIGAVGTASATAASPFTITAAEEVDQKSGLLFFGFGPRAQPFQGGLHCIELPTKRVGVQNSGGAGPCTGSFAFDMRDYIQSGVHPGLVPGAMVYCQWWSRDPLDPAGFGTSLTNALSFGIAP